MKKILKSAFNISAAAVGGTGVILGTVWTMGETIGLPNGFVDPVNVIAAASLTAASASIFALGDNRFFFSGKTTEAIKNLFNPKP